ncbi:MAG: hypothetical protein NVS3B26_07270 [Mycobacteriales bacterium]
MTNPIERAIFDVASALEVPVLVAALVALAVVVVELGGFAVELRSRRGRRIEVLTDVAERARRALGHDDRASAGGAVAGVARSAAMGDALAHIVEAVGRSHEDARVSKALADFDLHTEGALARTRLLVRVGPALGLMGTLIPLSPALEGLARGRITQLTDNLRIAFSVTVLGLLIGAIAFALTLYRDRFYGQDYSDLEYVAAVLTGTERSP